MPRFFVDPFSGEETTLTGEDAKHIAKSLRMREGEEVTLCDGNGADYRCRIVEADPAGVRVEVLDRRASTGEMRCRISLYQAIPKGDKLDFIVQKAVELGACEVVPVLTARCISRPDQKAMAKKVERLQRIALEAAKQSGRGMVPRVMPLLRFSEALARMNGASQAILFYEEAQTPLRQVLRTDAASIAVMVGSEGGFSPEEAKQAEESGAALASLGGRILRCETAPICALSAIGYAVGAF